MVSSELNQTEAEGLRNASLYRIMAGAAAFVSPNIAPSRRRRSGLQRGRQAVFCCSAAPQILETIGTPARGPNAARLARFLAADWHNPEQSLDNPQFWAHIHACFRPLPNSFLNGYAMYTESAYDYNLGAPYKTSIVLIVDAPESVGSGGANALELASFKIRDPEEFMLGSHEPELLEELTRDHLIPLPCECNTVYVWIEDQQQYIGFSRPGKGCVIRRGGKERPTYLDSKIVLSKDRYAPWDIGRDLDTDERVWGGAAGAFDFIAKSRFDDQVSDDFES